jgi:hypothetical protein
VKSATATPLVDIGKIQKKKKKKKKKKEESKTK